MLNANREKAFLPIERKQPEPREGQKSLWRGDVGRDSLLQGPVQVLGSGRAQVRVAGQRLLGALGAAGAGRRGEAVGAQAG